MSGMERFLSRNEDALIVFVAVEVITTALFVDAATRLGATDALGRGKVGRAITLFGWDLVFPTVLILALALHFFLHRTTMRVEERNRTHALDKILEVATRAFVYPGSWDALEVRGFCHKFDSKKKMLVPVACKMSHEHDDTSEPLPVDAKDSDGQYVFVIGEAFRTNKTIFRELPSDRTQLEVDHGVWTEIRSVLACPVHDADRPSLPIGTVSFDCSDAGLALLHKDYTRATDIIHCLASAASTVLE